MSIIYNISPKEALRAEGVGGYGVQFWIGDNSRVTMSSSQAEALRAQLNRIFNPEGAAELDRAWAVVNALGGPGRHDMYDSALDDALAEIQKLGGMDPLQRAAQEREERS